MKKRENRWTKRGGIILCILLGAVAIIVILRCFAVGAPGAERENETTEPRTGRPTIAESDAARETKSHETAGDSEKTPSQPSGYLTEAPTEEITAHSRHSPEAPTESEPTVPETVRTASPDVVSAETPSPGYTEIPVVTEGLRVTPEAASTGKPTAAATEVHTLRPTAKATESSTATPTIAPTNPPASTPTTEPTAAPTIAPTGAVTNAPTDQPTGMPTREPTFAPTNPQASIPTTEATAAPTIAPTGAVANAPTDQPTGMPTREPTIAPTNPPASIPTTEASAVPTPEATFLPWSENVLEYLKNGTGRGKRPYPGGKVYPADRENPALHGTVFGNCAQGAYCGVTVSGWPETGTEDGVILQIVNRTALGESVPEGVYLDADHDSGRTKLTEDACWGIIVREEAFGVFVEHCDVDSPYDFFQCEYYPLPTGDFVLNLGGNPIVLNRIPERVSVLFRDLAEEGYEERWWETTMSFVGLQVSVDGRVVYECEKFGIRNSVVP